MFVDYEYYQSHGGTLPQTQFNKFEPKAEKLVIVRTGGKDLTHFTEPVSDAICDIIDVYYEKSQTEEVAKSLQTNKSISSEKVGSYSVSYNKMTYAELRDMITNYDKDIEAIIFNNLWTTGLLYQGMTNVRY